MSVRELIVLSLQRIGANPLRSALTMLGVIIGVASVVAVVAVGQGSGVRISSSISALGTNLLTISAGGQFNGLVRGAAGSASTLSLEDAAAIAELASVAAVAPTATTQQVVAYGDENTTTTITGTTSSYLGIRAYEIWQGSFLNEAAEDYSLRVAVLGADTAETLGLDADDLGSQIRIGGLPFTVIGILQPKGGVGGATDDVVFVPLATLAHQLVGGDSLSSISVSVVEGNSTSAASSLVSALLRARHGINDSQDSDFSVASHDQLLEVATSVSDTLTLLLVAIGSISLVVGGIGIMNIMLVSVRERTREIGIRKAIGAKRRDVLAQFLVEAVVLSVLGGILGVAMGALASFVIGQVAGWGFVFSLPTVGIALGFSALIGIVFGVWPARQAAVLDPIVALRYE
ncbi:MAG: ABC transporter permease [Chloroflexota bacterium]